MNVSASAFCPQIAVSQYAPNGPETVQIQHILNHRLCLICSAYFPCQYSVLLVRVEGVKDGDEKVVEYDMVDFYDEDRGITSMAKTTGFTAAIIARTLGRGAIKAKGIQWPVRVVNGELFVELLGKLRERGVEVTETVTTTREI